METTISTPYLKLKINNSEEFDDLVLNKDIRISNSIVNNIINNLKNNILKIKVLELEFLEYRTILDVFVSREDFHHSLNQNLIIHESNELYEECIKIKEAIEFIESNPEKFGIVNNFSYFHNKVKE
jgi:hypothetical protein